MKKRKKVEMPERRVMEIGKISMKNPKEKLFLALFRGILIFFAVYGSVGVYLSGFTIPYDENLVVSILAIISLYMGMIYYNKWTENIGYIVLLTGFALSAFYMRTYIESGFAAMMNETTEVLSGIYDLPAIRMFQEILDDRYTAITICVIFISIFVGILFNIIIARYMNFWGALAMIMPSVGIVFFFDRIVEKKYILMLSVVVIIVAILKKEGNYKDKKSLLLRIRKQNRQNRKLWIVKGSIFIQMGIVLLAIMGLFFGIIQMVYPQGKFKTPSKWQSFREDSNDTIRTIMMVGFPSFITGQYGKGGISGGNLSGAVSVTPDYLTDLMLTFVPYTRETMYLRAFTGVDYEGKKWSDQIKGNYSLKDIPAEQIHNKQSNLLKKAYENDKSNKRIQTKMTIQNEDANEKYGYFPYYSIIEEGEQYHFGEQEIILGSFQKKASYMITYYPYSEGVQATGEDAQLEERYAAYAEEYYTQIPEKNKQILSDICDLIGREGTEQEKVERVVQYLETECSYSKKPGAVPRGEDFVNYFLTKKRRGFCMHFASAGTLLLREMGIPARYVEGYAIPYSDVLNGESLDDQEYEKWFSGENPLGKTAVMEVEVDDSLAHAWVEVYQKGFGWKVVDVTPAYYGEVDDEGFWDDLRNAFRLQENNEGGNPLQVQEIANGMKITIMIVSILFVIVFGGRILSRTIWKELVQRITYRRLYKSRLYNQCITYEYQYFCRYLAQALKQEELTDKEPKELFLKLQQDNISKTDTEKMTELVEKALYSNHMLEQTEHDWCRMEMKKIVKTLRK